MKKIYILLLVFLFSISAFGQNYIGYKHKGAVFGETLPNGAKDLGGGLLSDEDYGVSRFSKGKKLMLWLEKITSRDAEGVPDWEVKDVLTFSKLKKHQEFLFSYSSPCTLKSEQKLELIVLAELVSKKKTYKILKAWQVNLDEEKFETLSTEEIECVYAKP
ncbi:MAG: hypothetical protein WA584_07565 [Pyrinomonadaceae bacterium]